jgi:hypothetical protein
MNYFIIGWFNGDLDKFYMQSWNGNSPSIQLRNNHQLNLAPSLSFRLLSRCFQHRWQSQPRDPSVSPRRKRASLLPPRKLQMDGYVHYLFRRAIIPP